MTLKSDAIPITSIPHSETTGQTSTDHHGAIDLVADTTPQLGGNLDANSHDITGMGHVGFLATQDSSAGANDLDDYEEGTWTPTVVDYSNNVNENQTYSAQAGRYVKIGRLVYIVCRIITLSTGTLASGDGIRVMGLPFTSGNISNYSWPIAVSMGQGMNKTANTGLTGQIDENSARCGFMLWADAAGSRPMLISEWSSNGGCSFAGCYEVS